MILLLDTIRDNSSREYTMFIHVHRMVFDIILLLHMLRMNFSNFAEIQFFLWEHVRDDSFYDSPSRWKLANLSYAHAMGTLFT